MKTELLAPAGDIEAGYAAIHYGADAVYLGLKSFSARASIVNFGEEELNEFVGYAHHKKRRVFVAINTIVQEKELPLLLKSLDICKRCNVDAVIIQDLGVARVVRESYPELEMHASTQMAIHNKEGALALQKIGFKRVVLARELSLEEIKDIASIPNLETEVFVHGALCYSYSGMCLFSSMENMGSANRGRCSSPCRALYDSKLGRKHLFSMKDLALGEDVLKLPVTSLKIEGRKKNALYVAAITDYYRHILDGKGAIASKEEKIKQIFSRPWSKFHFNGKEKGIVEPEFVGHRGIEIGKVEQIIKGNIVFHTLKGFSLRDGLQIEIPGEDKPFGFSVQLMRVKGQSVFEAKARDEVSVKLPPQARRITKGLKIFLASTNETKNAYGYEKPKQGEFSQKGKVDVLVQVFEEKVVASSLGFVVQQIGKFSPAEQYERVEKSILDAFSKTGDCVFYLNNLQIENEKKLFVPISMLNELRRNLYSKIEIDYEKGEQPLVDEPRTVVEKSNIIRTDDLDNISQIDFSNVDEIIYMLRSDADLNQLKNLPKNKLRIALPIICRKPQDFVPLINKLISSGYKKWEVNNYWGLEVLPEKNIDLSIDGSIYMLNTQAIQMAKELGASRVSLSIEDSLSNIKLLAEKSPIPIVMPVYQDPALYTSEVCMRPNSCSNCSKETMNFSFEKDNKKYVAIFKNCMTLVIDEKPVCFAKEAKEVKADFYKTDFIHKKYSPSYAKAIYGIVNNFEDIENCKKANLINDRFF